MMRRTQIRSLRSGEDVPPGEPKRYEDPRGYVRLRWKVAPATYVEVYEHRLDAGIPDSPVSIHPRPPLDPQRFGGYCSKRAQEKALRATERRRERDEFVAEVTRLYAEGKTTIEVGEILGRDPSNITRAMQSIGVRGRSPASYATPMDASEVMRLYVDDQMTPEDIGHRLGISSTRVRKLIRARGAMRRAGRPRNSGRRSYQQEFDEVRPLVLKRARWECEFGFPGCTYQASHVHHRKMRSQGGGNELANLLASCSRCHHEIHRSPSVAYANGWLVRSFGDPASVPALLARGLVTVGSPS